MKITNEEIERMLAASPGSTPEILAEGFERRAGRGKFPPQAQLDAEMARALRAYALQSSRAVYSLVAVAGGASFHGARFDDIQLPPANGGAL